MRNIAANISVLFRELPLLQRFDAARDAGFNGVEIQFPYNETSQSLRAAARASGMPVLLINGPVLPDRHPFGISGRPELRDAFRAQLPQILEYADALDVKFVHILAGTEPSANRDSCFEVHIDNLMLAAQALGVHGIQVLIEPLNPIDAPHYLIGSLDDALYVLERCSGQVGMQFDVYHVTRMNLNPATELLRLLPWVRHVQFADAPGRHEPGTGHVAFATMIQALEANDYRGWISAEYIPLGTTISSLQWLTAWRGGVVDAKAAAGSMLQSGEHHP